MEHPFRVIKQQFVFQKTRLRGMAKNHCKMMVLAALTNLFFGEKEMISNGSIDMGVVCQHTAFTVLLRTMKAIEKRNKAF